MFLIIKVSCLCILEIILYLVFVHKVKSLFQNVRVRGLDSLKIGSVLKYITDLKAENNNEIGHYGQTLNRAKRYKS